MLSVWHKADIYRIPIYAPVTLLLAVNNWPAYSSQKVAKPMRLAAERYDADYSSSSSSQSSSSS